jgi:hypothetical protein
MDNPDRDVKLADLDAIGEFYSVVLSVRAAARRRRAADFPDQKKKLD